MNVFGRENNSGTRINSEIRLTENNSGTRINYLTRLSGKVPLTQPTENIPLTLPTGFVT